MTMTSSKPYLIRAIYEWILDNEQTPYLAVNTKLDDVNVPMDYAANGRIILNISPSACRGLHLDNERIIFSARFAGVAQQISLPPAAVLAIYAKENGRGMIFGEEGHIEIGGGVDSDSESIIDGGSGDEAPPATNKNKKAKLTVIK
jgi:stringent starvation protein B